MLTSKETLTFAENRVHIQYRMTVTSIWYELIAETLKQNADWTIKDI